jgi:hypothetical protein
MAFLHFDLDAAATRSPIFTITVGQNVADNNRVSTLSQPLLYLFT